MAEAISTAGDLEGSMQDKVTNTQSITCINLHCWKDQAVSRQKEIGNFEFFKWSLHTSKGTMYN